MDDRLKQIAEHYGLDKQLGMLQEECAELIQAVNKYRRTRTTAIVEEMADVYIMLAQITYLLNKKLASCDVEEYISLWMEKKIRRQLERIEDKDVHGLAAGDIVTTPLGDKAIIIGIEEWNETKLASVYSDKFAFPQIFPVQELKATGVRKDNIKTILSDLLKENEDGNKDT